MKFLKTFAMLFLVALSTSSFGAAPDHVGISLVGEINTKTALQAIKFIDLANQQKAKSITLEINSEGGEQEAGFLIAKAIERSPARVTCIVDGQASSMAFYILQSCDTRMATARSFLMIHEVTLVTNLTSGNVESVTNLIRVSNAGVIEHCSAKLKITKEDFAARIKGKDRFMTPDEAVEIGALDGVLRTRPATTQIVGPQP
jgi:ATP-dependent protease ClpP protease subunit